MYTSSHFGKLIKAVTLASKSNLMIKGKPVEVDPELIFQRLAFLRERLVGLPSLFKYEHCTHLPAVFASYCILLEVKTPVIADVF